MTWDPFGALGLPRRFDLGRDEIERAYLARAAETHPDLVTAGDAGAPGDAGDLNRARQDLADPETRASVLLALLGGPGKEQDRGLPPGFLMEMMEVREQMEAAAGAGDRDQIERWERWAEEQRAGHVRAVAELFAATDASGPDPRTLRSIRERLNAWRYIERMLDQMA